MSHQPSVNKIPTTQLPLVILSQSVEKTVRIYRQDIGQEERAQLNKYLVFLSNAGFPANRKGQKWQSCLGKMFMV